MTGPGTWTGPRRLARAITDPDQQAQVLAGLARRRRRRVTGPGRALADRAEAAARAITDPDRQARTLAELAQAAASAGDLDRAEAVARAITDPDLAGVGAGAGRGWREAVAEAGDLDRAEALAQAITDPDRRDAGAGRAGSWRRRRRVTWTGPRRLARAITDPD